LRERGGERGRKEWGAGDIDVLKRACETIIAARCADESAAVTGPAETVIKPEGMLQQDGSRAKASATKHALCDCDTAAITYTVSFKPPFRVAIVYLHIPYGKIGGFGRDDPAPSAAFTFCSLGVGGTYLFTKF